MNDLYLFQSTLSRWVSELRNLSVPAHMIVKILKLAGFQAQLTKEQVMAMPAVAVNMSSLQAKRWLDLIMVANKREGK